MNHQIDTQCTKFLCSGTIFFFFLGSQTKIILNIKVEKSKLKQLSLGSNLFVQTMVKLILI